MLVKKKLVQNGAETGLSSDFKSSFLKQNKTLVARINSCPDIEVWRQRLSTE